MESSQDSLEFLDDSIDSRREAAIEESGATEESSHKNVFQFAQKYQGQAKRSVENLNRYVRENPIQAMILGFGTGIIAGVFLRSRRRG